MDNNTENISESASENVCEEKEGAASKKQQQPKKPVNVWMIVAIIFLIVSIVLGCLLAFPNTAAKVGFNTTNDGNNNQSTNIGSPEAAQAEATKAVQYIQKNFDPSITFNKVDSSPVCYYKIGLNYQGQVINSYISTDGNYLFTGDPINIGNKVDGNFEKTNDQICQENGKPVIYFFGMTTCPHCKWEEPIIKSVVNSFGDAIVYKEDILSEGGTGFANDSIFKKYNPTGGVPTLVLGCKYFRIGSGESAGEEAEKASLTKLICELTNNQPASVCNK
ncbi:MAG TPA: thioredoxin family protein [Candidatus Pacearchaeota archaeon]|jgi:flagellar basal body-associated protein FliL|nr:thioredoxin family protein [Candidatus Pacearchaeota archaeon]HRR94939.1 thioredoxin family protein [Candidatus Paceibacterota bacterium]HQG09468.1 thioredoxin family protein [Candidatus Pacearchaeota archaeon]HQH20281.1 thioredoxin family protein [Candidatus Pacearchaeota archaeon]HQK58497.1 thioredoxin family protein [Candidatus Pacearchaeota archaeon]